MMQVISKDPDETEKKEANNQKSLHSSEYEGL